MTFKSEVTDSKIIDMGYYLVHFEPLFLYPTKKVRSTSATPALATSKRMNHRFVQTNDIDTELLYSL